MPNIILERCTSTDGVRLPNEQCKVHCKARSQEATRVPMADHLGRIVFAEHDLTEFCTSLHNT